MELEKERWKCGKPVNRLFATLWSAGDLVPGDDNDSQLEHSRKENFHIELGFPT